MQRQLRQSKEHFHPPQTKSPSQYRQRASILTTIPISGGRFRPRRVITSGRQIQPGNMQDNNTTLPEQFHPPKTKAPSQDKSTLPRQKHPPKTGKPPQFQPYFPSREGETAPGGSKRQPKGAQPVKDTEVRPEMQRESFLRLGAGAQIHAEG